MNGGEKKLKKAYWKAVLLAICMVTGMVLVAFRAVLAHLLSPSFKGLVITPTHPYYEYIRWSLLALSTIGILLAERISRELNLTPSKLADPPKALSSHSAVVSCACGLVGAVGIVFFLLAGNITDMYIFAGVSVGFSVAYFPTYSKWKVLATPWLRSTAPEIDAQPEPQPVRKVKWKAIIIIFGVLSLVVGAHTFYRDNALEETYGWFLWAGGFPAVMIALLYFFYVVEPSLPAEGRRMLSEDFTSPTLKHVAIIGGSLVLGLMVCTIVQSAAVGSMDRLNSIPIKVESLITRVGVDNSRRCRVTVYLAYDKSLCLWYSGEEPLKTPWPLAKMSADEIHGLRGQRVILVGRKSFAGTVIDEIRLPDDK